MDTIAMTDDQYQHLRESLSEIAANVGKLEILQREQNGRVRKNEAAIAVQKQWRESEWPAYKIESKEHRSGLRLQIQRLNDEMCGDIDDLNRAVQSLALKLAEQNSTLEMVRKWGVPVLLAVAIILNALGIKLPF